MEDPSKQVSVWGKDGSLASWKFNIVDRRGSGSYKALHMEKNAVLGRTGKWKLWDFCGVLTQMDRKLYLMISELIMCCICFV